MRLLADENVPGDIVLALREEGHDVVWVASDAPSVSDAAVLRRAQVDNRIIVTFDKDFGELAFLFGLSASSGVVLVRLEASSPSRAVEVVIGTLRSRGDWAGHFTVVSFGRVRMVLLPNISDTSP